MIGRLLARLRRQAAPTAALIARANSARDEARFEEAAHLYAGALAAAPGRTRLRVQLGHMLKEAGHYEAAEQAYLTAHEALPHDADLALQLGHFYKTVNRLEDAEQWYGRALALSPGWTEATSERAAVARLARPLPAGAVLASDLAPGAALPRAPADGLHLKRLGRPEAGPWGTHRTLRGIEAIHGFFITAAPLTALDILIDGRPFHHVAFDQGHSIALDAEDSPRRKYVFNAWVDCTALSHGLRLIELRFTAGDVRVHVWREHVVVAAPVPERDYPGSDALVGCDPADPRPIEEQIRARPSMVRPARRSLFPDGVHNILVLRTDQLGDVVASIPAMQRLRALAPKARIVGLLTAANADLARTLGLFDKVIVIDFPDDPVERRRLMPLADQEALRERLAHYQFDIAIDLAPSNVSRPLLRLSGARFLHGFGGDEWPWLDGRLRFDTPDRWGGMDTAPHATRVTALIEALGAILDHPVPLIRRDDLPPDLLAPLGLAAGTRYALLHTGARIAFSRWPHHAALAALLLERTDLEVVLIAAEPGTSASLPADLLASPRFHLIDRLLDFDTFDALVSNAAIVVGNDSGPKHLAALRGVPTVTLFTARIGWSEWGQEEVGTIISRRVPCAGCAIFHDAEECGHDFSCIRGIRVEEVFATMQAIISAP